MLKRLLSIITILAIIVCVAGCAGKGSKSTNTNLVFSSVEKEYKYSFLKDDSSQIVRVDKSSAEQFLKTVSQVSLDYEYADLYGVTECYDRIFTNASVSKHEHSALNKDGRLTAEHLVEIVKENNNEFYNQDDVEKGFYEEAEDDLVDSLCKLIVETINEVKNRYPDIDFDRVYCNLSRLKIFYKVGSLDFAAVTPDMILQLGKASLKFADLMSGNTGTRNVIIHEIMHMIQLGCTCEKIKHCERRAGITYRWDDVKLQGNDWAWFFEGSAEKNMCMLTGEDAITYQQMINYLQSVNLATFLNSNISANYAETISFYNDPNKLFELFNAQSKEEITEIANLMEAIQIIQYFPDEFKEAYKNKYGLDLSSDDEQAKIRMSLKPAICLTFSKAFYRNLANALTENDMTVNDVFFLIHLFESAMDYHTTYSNTDRMDINKPFIDNYRIIRNKFFEMFKKENVSIDENSYNSFELILEEINTVNASFNWLKQDKKFFLLERTEFLNEQLSNFIS